MWIKEQINPENDYPQKNIAHEDIMCLPIENIAPMAEQIRIEWKTQCGLTTKVRKNANRNVDTFRAIL
jgi:hypothetical protein